MDLADVMQHGAGQQQISIYVGIIGCDIKRNFGDLQGMLKQPADAGMMEGLGCRRHFKQLCNFRILKDTQQQ